MVLLLKMGLLQLEQFMVTKLLQLWQGKRLMHSLSPMPGQGCTASLCPQAHREP